MSCIEDAVKKTSETWQPIQVGEEDPNSVDVFHVADMVKQYCNLNLGTPGAALSKKDMAKTLVMTVQEQLFPHVVDIVRSRDHVQLAKDLRNVGAMVLEKYPGFGSLEEAIAKSLYLVWLYSNRQSLSQQECEGGAI
jgi:hypothetical protein